jgi:hypothetical protein
MTLHNEGIRNLYVYHPFNVGIDDWLDTQL